MGYDRGELDRQLRDIGEGERWWDVPEFRELPYVLHPEERLTGVVIAKLLGSGRSRLRRSGRWLVVATDQRVICLKHERFGRKQVDIPAGQILRMHQSSRFGKLQVTIECSHQRYRIRVAAPDSLRFGAAVAGLLPVPSGPLLPPDLEALQWIPGFTRMAAAPGVAGLLARVSVLSPPEYASRQQVEALASMVDRLQSEVSDLQQQVRFLEDLLARKSDEASLLPGRPLP